MDWVKGVNLLMKKNVTGVFSERFMRIETDDGVGQQIIINRKPHDDIIDLNVRQLVINDESEARELIKLIEDGIAYLCK